MNDFKEPTSLKYEAKGQQMIIVDLINAIISMRKLQEGHQKG